MHSKFRFYLLKALLVHSVKILADVVKIGIRNDVLYRGIECMHGFLGTLRLRNLLLVQLIFANMSANGKGLSDDQRSAIMGLRTEFGADLPEEYDSDFNLFRWLVAWDYRNDVVIPRLKRTLAFRSAMGLDRVPKDPGMDFGNYLNKNFSEAVVRWYPGGISGYDNAGNVVVMEALGRCDPKGIASCARFSEFIQCRLVEGERAWQMVRAQEDRLGRRCGVLYVIDLEGMCMDQVWMPALQLYMTVLILLQEHYPELLTKLLIIRPPALFTIAYRLVYPALSNKTRKKVQVISGDEWKSELSTSISPENLPVRWGGTQVGADNCPFGVVRPGGKVPSTLKYDPKKNPEGPRPEETVRITVPGWDKKRISVRADGGKTLKWHFSVKSGDVLFGIYSQKSGGSLVDTSEMKIEVPKIRLNTEFVPEWGSLKVPDEGRKYVIEFDNSVSLFVSKTVLYCIKIV